MPTAITISPKKQGLNLIGNYLIAQTEGGVS